MIPAPQGGGEFVPAVYPCYSTSLPSVDTSRIMAAISAGLHTIGSFAPDQPTVDSAVD